MNILHYFSYDNQTQCVEHCLQIGVKYCKDKYKNTPLEYAIKRNSKECVSILLAHAIIEVKIIDSMDKTSIIDLICFSPFNLHDFFNNSYTVHDYHGLEKFAKLKYQPCIFENSFNVIDTAFLETYFS